MLNAFSGTPSNVPPVPLGNAADALAWSWTDSSNDCSKSGEVTGKAKVPNYGFSTAAELTTAVSNMETTYTDAAGRSTTGDNLNLGGGEIGGLTLVKGVYNIDKNVKINDDLIFTGSATDVFIIQTTGNVIQDAATNTILKGEVKAENIFWHSLLDPLCTDVSCRQRRSSSRKMSSLRQSTLRHQQVGDYEDYR